MKRIKNADINFKVNPKRINLNNFSMKFYTVNSEAYFFIKDQDNLVSVERDATIYDEDVIISGGTKVLDYYLPLDWSELVQLGEGVLNYRCINNIDDPYFPDMAYNQVVEDTTGYYIDSDIIVDPSQTRNIIERVTELESGLAVESIDREEADTFISGAVDTEVARAISAETELSERIDELESGASEALDAEIERAISAETALQDAIDAEEARAIAIENAIRQDLTDESELRSSADTAMWTAINNETTRATSAETAIENKVDVETLRAIGVENAISGDLQTYKATNNAALQAETTRATSAETALQSAINDEATARANADAALGTRIDNISSASTAAIEAEAARAQEAESGLTNAINNEVTRATSAETIIANSLNAEINRASSAETALNNQIDAEVLRATAAEAELEAKIGVVSGVTELINAETLRATTAENALDEKIGNVSGSVISEEARAISAETALDNKIYTVSGNVLTEEARANGIEDILSGAIDTLDVRFFDNAKYENSGNTKVINFYNAGVVKATIDATDFIKDGMISTVELVQSGSTSVLVITWNTDAGSQVTTIDVGDIFEADNYYTKSETSGATEISTALAQKLAISDFNTYSGAVDTAINSKASQTDLNTLSGTVTGHTSDRVIHVTSSDKEKWNKVDDKADTTALTAVNDTLTAHTSNSSIHLTTGNVQTQIDQSISGKANSSDVYLKTETSGATELTTAFEATQPKLSAGTGISIDANNVISSTASITIDPTLDSGSTNAVANSAITTAINSKLTNILRGEANWAGSGVTTLNVTYNGTNETTRTFCASINNKQILTGSDYSKANKFSLVETSAITTSVTSASTDSQIPSAKAVYDALGSASGGITSGEVQTMIESATTPIYQAIEEDEEVTAAAFNALNAAVSGKADSSAVYLKSETSGATEIATALSGKQDTLSAGTNITIVDNVISATGGGGGKAISAGRGISVTTGETADTVSFNLPISGGSGTNSIIIGAGESASLTGSLVHGIGSYSNGIYSNVFGYNCFSNGHYSFLAGGYLNNYTEYGVVFGKYNDTTNSPLFSVGNGTDVNTRHNAFEIRQNGDIYLSSGGTDIKLQDHLGGGGGGGKAIEAGRGISVTTGETADTVSFDLPISAGTGTNSIVEGYNTKASGHSSHAEGYNTIAKGSQAHSEGRNTTASGVYSHAEGENTYAGGSKSHTEGSYTEANNEAEHASGQFNVSSKASGTFGDSGNTLFSVGNGTSTSARHNAFEIRQNGDIYLNDGTKLQDTITATASNTTALGGLSLVKLTQAQYDALSTKDNNTLYVIVG